MAWFATSHPARRREGRWQSRSGRAGVHLNPAQVKQLAVGIHAQFLQALRAHALHGVFLRDTGDAPPSHEWRSSAKPHC